MKTVISKCGKYRYVLERSWSRDPRYLLFIMLNPSTADAETDDPTIRRCKGFAQILGYDGILVGNLYAYRTPHPRVLKQAALIDDVVGPENDRWLKRLEKASELTIAAWGQPGPLPGRVNHVDQLMSRVLHCFGECKTGEPRHPLMLPKTARPRIYL